MSYVFFIAKHQICEYGSEHSQPQLEASANGKILLETRRNEKQIFNLLTDADIKGKNWEWSIQKQPGKSNEPKNGILNAKWPRSK